MTSTSSNKTPFSKVYDSFLSKVTDDMYMELTELETFRLLEDLLISAIPYFEFPRVNINDYDLDEIIDEDTYCGIESDDKPVKAIIFSGGNFNVSLTAEEINVLSTYMIVEWMGQQLASVENIRMKYSGSDFKFTSQANHMSKILTIQKDYERKGFHLQRLYKRRLPNDEGIMQSTMGTIMESYPEGRRFYRHGYKI
jgi:hypothetical protein